MKSQTGMGSHELCRLPSRPIVGDHQRIQDNRVLLDELLHGPSYLVKPLEHYRSFRKYKLLISASE